MGDARALAELKRSQDDGRLSNAVAGFLIAAGLAFGSAASANECEDSVVENEFVLGAPICLPSAPERIVVLDPTFSLGMSLELGLPVVGAPIFDMSDAVLKSEAVSLGVADIGSMAQPSVEAIVALQPDLILGSVMAEPYLPILSQIAPVALVTTSDWKEYYHAIGAVSGTSAEVEGAFAEYDARVTELQNQVPDTVVSVLRITDWDFQVYLDGPNAYGPFDVLRDVGVKRSQYETTEETEVVKRPDWEQLAALDGDMLLYIVGGANDSDVSGRHEEVLNNPLWQLLPAVAAGDVHRVDPGVWMEFSGLGSAHRVLDDVEHLIVVRE
ncbi:MAG: iron-siderophore ABC transporter substrate-binding protein [Pseudomonadota bacterium]